MRRVTIMRGIPGSGKSSWVKRFRPDAFVCSADLFHTDGLGNYHFDATKAKDAHNWCLEQFVKSLGREVNDVVVDNTNTKVFELAPYYRLAEVFGYEVQIVWLVVGADIAILRGIHNVPEATVKAMAVGVEPLPAWWDVLILTT